MTSQSLQESLSALMDNEADELEIRRVLQASAEDPALRKTWERYQVARAVMHQEPWQARVDLSAGIAAAIADEPVPSIVEPRTSRLWQNMGRMAVAASVTLAVLVGFNMFNQDGSPTEPNMVAEQTVPAVAPVAAVANGQGGAVLAGFQSGESASSEAQAPSAWHEQRIGTYLREHAEQGARSDAPNLLPHARAASLEER
ncbi:MAG: sigma-E factor negative regulatory protein [Pseudomonas sp.]